MRLVMKPGRFLDDHDFFAHALADFDGGGQRVVVRFERAHDFEQLHFVDGIEEVHAYALFRSVSDAGDLGHAER